MHPSHMWPGPASEAAIRIRVPYSTSLVWSVSKRGWSYEYEYLDGFSFVLISLAAYLRVTYGCVVQIGMTTSTEPYGLCSC